MDNRPMFNKTLSLKERIERSVPLTIPGLVASLIGIVGAGMIFYNMNDYKFDDYKSKTHIIQKNEEVGDVCSDMGVKFFSLNKCIDYIVQQNNLKNEYDIKSGQELIIPDLDSKKY